MLEHVVGWGWSKAKEANSTLLKAASCVSTARLGLKFEFRTDSLADALKAANPQSKSGAGHLALSRNQPQL